MNVSAQRRSLTVAQRIYAGFGLIIAALLFVGSAGFWALGQARAGFLSFRDASSRARTVLELDHQVTRLASEVESYSHTGHQAVAARAAATLGELKDASARLHGLLHSDRERDIHSRMEAELSAYEETFAFAQEERRARDALVRTTIPSLVDALRAHIKDKPSLPSGQAFELQLAVSGAETETYRYIEDPEYNRLFGARKRLTEAARRLEDKGHPKLSGEFRALSQAIQRVAQRTRGYLFLTSVVLAGAAQEFGHLATTMRADILNEVEPLATRVGESTARTRALVGAVSLLALLLGISFSTRIARSISTPLHAITRTLRRLAEGDKDAAIPGLHRNDEIGIMAQAADVFKRKNAETEHLLAEAERLGAALAERTHELERSNDEMEQFVYTVSHDLKSPVVTSLGFLGMIKDLVDDGQLEAAISKLPKVERANKRMGQLIDDLLTLSRVGRVDVEMAPVEMNALLAQVLENLDAKLKACEIDAAIEGNLPSLLANASQVQQVFDNLINNAAKYAKNEDGSVVRIGAEEDDGHIRFYVRDNGPGVPPEYHDRIFGLFQRLNKDGDGTGIGLSIVQKAMRLHHGEVSVESEGGGSGCTFWLSFPKNSKEASP